MGALVYRQLDEIETVNLVMCAHANELPPPWVLGQVLVALLGFEILFQRIGSEA
jgi:hypothetical protein